MTWAVISVGFGGCKYIEPQSGMTYFLMNWPASRSADSDDLTTPAATATPATATAPAATVNGRVQDLLGTDTPILLLHGVGMGLLPYINFVRAIVASGTPLLAPEYKHVSMRLCNMIPTADQVATTV